jgi:hypothetical protein
MTALSAYFSGRWFEPLPLSDVVVAVVVLAVGLAATLVLLWCEASTPPAPENVDLR